MSRRSAAQRSAAQGSPAVNEVSERELASAWLSAILEPLARLDSTLEATGAEFLVLGLLLVGRWATDYDGGFLIRNFDTDFVAFVELNRGYRYSRKGRSESGRKAPRVFVFPVSVVRDAQSKTSTSGKVFLRSIDDVESYLDSWEQVRASLKTEGLSDCECGQRKRVLPPSACARACGPE